MSNIYNSLQNINLEFNEMNEKIINCLHNCKINFEMKKSDDNFNQRHENTMLAA